MSDAICEICSAEGAHNHYGGMACSSCRVFFIRTVNRKKKPYECSEDKNCPIHYDKIKKCCKACRYAKCCEANMSATEVGKYGKANDLENSVVPYFQKKYKAMIKSTVRCSMSVGFHYADTLKNSSPVEFANTLVMLERFCENNEGPKGVTSFNCNLDVSLADVLQYPEITCARLPVAWEVHHLTDSMTNLLHLTYCRYTTQFADFISTAPELNQINSREKLTLVSANFCGVGLLTIVYNGWLQHFREGLVFPFGFRFVPRSDDNNEMNAFLRTLVHFIQEKIFPLMDELQLTMAEYVILKMIALFNPCLSIGDIAKEVVQGARNRYCHILVDYLSQIYREFPQEWRIKRLSTLFLLLKEFRVAAAYDDQMCARMVTLDIGQMRGNLPYDIHIRQY